MVVCYRLLEKMSQGLYTGLGPVGLVGFLGLGI